MKHLITALSFAVALAAPAFVPAQDAAPAAEQAEAPADPYKIKPEHAAKGTIFYVNDARGRDNVTFTSEAPLEDIIGTTNRITGYIAFDPLNPVAGGAGRFSVPVATLNTGIPMRNEHLQGAQWLNAAEHPEIILEINEIKDLTTVKTGEGFETYEAMLVGTFEVAGAARPVGPAGCPDPQPGTLRCRLPEEPGAALPATVAPHGRGRQGHPARLCHRGRHGRRRRDPHLVG